MALAVDNQSQNHGSDIEARLQDEWREMTEAAEKY